MSLSHVANTACIRPLFVFVCNENPASKSSILMQHSDSDKLQGHRDKEDFDDLFVYQTEHWDQCASRQAPQASIRSPVALSQGLAMRV